MGQWRKLVSRMTQVMTSHFHDVHNEIMVAVQAALFLLCIVNGEVCSVRHCKRNCEDENLRDIVGL
jgi:hypothetical protein